MTEKLQKVLARAGLGSRREMERWIEAGRISVNDQTANLGDRVGEDDAIKVDGKTLSKQRTTKGKRRVLIYHKPVGEVTTRNDPEGRRTVFDHLPSIANGRWIVVGRLDINTLGLLLFTNDGELANRLMHPSSEIEREYAVRILGDVDASIINNLKKGVELEDGTQYRADYVISNADGRKTIYEMLGGRYMDRKVARYCQPSPADDAVAFAVFVCLGVNRDLSSYPSALILFLDEPEVIGGQECDHLSMQIFGFDSSIAPAGKGVIKVELFGKPSHFSRFAHDEEAYRAEKERIADQVIELLEVQFPGLREDIEVVDVPTLQTWERFMGGTNGHSNFPSKYKDPTDIRNVLDFIFGLNRMYTLPGLDNFFFVGQWVTSMGSLFSNALTGKSVIENICKQGGVRFVPPPVNGHPPHTPPDFD